MAKQTIGEFLSTLRKANGYTQQEVADRLGISNRTLSGWECNNVLPDILLLPALAEMYGVTVDEILAGERIEKNEVALTNKSERRILKSKIAKFSTQCWLLLGLIIIGVALVASCAVIDISILKSYDFLWWFALLVGIVLAAVCLSILLAFWKGAELFGEDTSDEYPSYCLILRKKLANCLYVIAAENAVATIVVAEVLIVRNQSHFFGVLACIAFGLVAVALFTTGWMLCKSALTNFGGEQGQNSIRRDRRHFWVIGFWGMFPLVLSVILAIVLGCVHIEDKRTIYQSSSVEEFVQHMETFGTVNKHLNLSELSKTAEQDEKYDLGDGYVAVYHYWSFTIVNEKVTILKLDDTGWNLVPYTIEAPRVFIVDEKQTFSFFNVRYRSYEESVSSGSQFGKHERFDYERVGDGYAYVHVITRDYSTIGYAVSFGVILTDVIVCAALCVARRNKFSVKM